MIELIHNGWKVTRQIGIGDRENVRAHLMQVGLFSHRCLEAQVNGAIDAALREACTLRAYTNGKRLQKLDPDLAFRLPHHTMKRARDHDLLLLDGGPADFRYAMERIDMFVEPLEDGLVAADLTAVLRQMWQFCGRGKLDAPGIARKSYDAAREMFPAYAIDLNRAWALFVEKP